MSYFVFLKNSDDMEGTIYKIAENEFDLNNLNINKSDYKILEDTQENFNAVKLNNKFVVKHVNDTITYDDSTNLFKNKQGLQNYINDLKNQIKQFLDNNLNHLLYNKWNSYYNQLDSLNLNSITYPLNKSLEQYFNDLNQPSYNILQLP